VWGAIERMAMNQGKSDISQVRRPVDISGFELIFQEIL
jgi:hypothetical protein